MHTHILIQGLLLFAFVSKSRKHIFNLVNFSPKRAKMNSWATKIALDIKIGFGPPMFNTTGQNLVLRIEFLIKGQLRNVSKAPNDIKKFLRNIRIFFHQRS